MELLINSTLSSFKKALRSFLQSPYEIKNFIYAGILYFSCFICAKILIIQFLLFLKGIDSNSSANLVFQDSVFSYDDFHLIVNDQLASQHSGGDASKQQANFNFNFNSKLIQENVQWKGLDKLFKHAKLLALHTTTTLSSQASSETFKDFINYINGYLNERTITDLLEETKLTGTLNVEKPSLYIFPAREGDCSFFTFNGFSMLINGGYDRLNPCFWRFASMLKQIDSVMITHQDSDALGGLNSFFSKKIQQPNVKPNVLSVLGNLVPLKHQSTEHGTNDADVILDAVDKLKLKLQPLVKHEQAHGKSTHQQPEHINLYFKYGYGSLDIYVLNPFANSNEYREFLNHLNGKINANIHKSHLNVNQMFKNIPISHLCSAVVLLAWTPSKPNENAIRILFTGNAPQHVVANALEKVKDFDLLQVPVYKIKEPANSVAHTVIKKPTSAPPAAPASTEKSTTEKSVVAKTERKSTANSEASHAKADKPAAAALNTSASAAKPLTNGISKQLSGPVPNKPPAAPKPTPAATATNGTNNKKEATNASEAKKPEVAKKPVAAKEPKEAKDVKDGKEEHSKEEKEKEVKKPVASKPPVKKDEVKAKPEKVENSRLSSAPAASKSEHNTKPTTAAVAPAPAKPRPSSAKPAPVAAKAEKVEKSEAAKTEKKPVATKPIAKNDHGDAAKKEAPKTSTKPTATSKTAPAKPTDKKDKKEATTNAEAKTTVVTQTVSAAAASVPTECVVESKVEAPIENEAPRTDVDSSKKTLFSSFMDAMSSAVNVIDSKLGRKKSTTTPPEPVKSTEDETKMDVQEAFSVEACEVVQKVIELKQEVEQDVVELNGQNGDTQQNGGFESRDESGEIVDQEEHVRKEVLYENKSEFNPNEVELFTSDREVRDNQPEECYVIESAQDDDNVEQANAEFVPDDDEPINEPNEIDPNASPNLSPVKQVDENESITSEDDVVVTEIQDEVQNDDRSESPREVVENFEPEEPQDNIEVVEIESEEQADGKESVENEEVEEQAEERAEEAEPVFDRNRLELSLDEVNAQQPCVVSDIQEFIKTPQHSEESSPIEENAPIEDVMTRSFIDNGDEQNPFNAPAKVDEPSENVSNEEVVDDAAEVPTEPSPEVDTLIDDFKSMNIEPQSNGVTNGHNGHHNGHHHNGHVEDNEEQKPEPVDNDLLIDIGTKDEDELATTQKTVDVLPTKQTPKTSDPATWNLLELPKPVNPAETNGSSTAVVNGSSTTANASDKKPTTPKRPAHAPPAAQSSPNGPSTAAPAKKEETSKSTLTTKSSTLNTSVSKSTSATAKPASAASTKPIHPLYFEVSYIPAHGNAFYVDSDYFKRVRARFYVLSTVEPSQHILNALLEAKQTWEDKELQVSFKSK